MSQNTKSQAWNGRNLRISLDPKETARKVHDAVACRAFNICERRGSHPGHELEDWRRAESEIVEPLGCGFLTREGEVLVDTDAAIFAEGTIEVSVEPRRLVISGRMVEQAKGGGTLLVFRTLDLPVAVDPSQVSAGFNGRILQIHLPRVQAASTLRTVRAA